MLKKVAVESAAEAYLELLAARGVEYFFGNAGTDFAPIIEAYASRQAEGSACRGRSRCRTRSPRSPWPMATPWSSGGRRRHGPRHRGRRQCAGWHHQRRAVAGAHPLHRRAHADHRERPARQPATATSTGRRSPSTRAAWRASSSSGTTSCEIAVSSRRWWTGRWPSPAASPQGPVYLTLPREVLAEPHETFEYADPPRLAPNGPTVAGPDEIAASGTPARRLGQPDHHHQGGRPRPPRGAGRWSRSRRPSAPPSSSIPPAPISTSLRTIPSTPASTPTPHLANADAVVVVEADAPWFPALRTPGPRRRIIQIGDGPALLALPDARLRHRRRPRRRPPADAGRAGRRPEAARGREGRRRAAPEAWEAETVSSATPSPRRARAVSGDSPIDMAWASRCVADCIDDNTIVVNEYDLDTTRQACGCPGTLLRPSPASGLGWGWGPRSAPSWPRPTRPWCAASVTAPTSSARPTAATGSSRAYKMPVLYVIFNNRVWNAVKRSVASHAPRTAGPRAPDHAAEHLEPAPDYEMVVAPPAAGARRSRIQRLCRRW